MPRAQTGITHLPPKNALILSFRVDDLPLRAMSIGHIAANVPGLANEMRTSTSGSDLIYSIGFNSLLWNFIWQGNLPPGFRPLEIDEEEEDDEDEDEMSSASDLTFCFFASNIDVLHQLAEECQVHLKNIARASEIVFATLVEDQNNNNLVEDKKSTATVLIDNTNPEFFQSSFLFTLRLAHSSETDIKLSLEEQRVFNQSLAKDLHSLSTKEPCLLHHLFSCQTERESSNYLLALSNRVDPFQNILDAVQDPSNESFQTPLENIEINPTLHFLPSLEILAALRMGTLRMGPLSPTAKWK